MAASPTAAATVVRMYMGGIAPEVTAQELRDRFGRLATASQCMLVDVELPPNRLTPQASSRGFAYLSIRGEKAADVVEEITKAYNRTKWRGGVLRVVIAKPDYQERWQREVEAREEAAAERRAAVEKERKRMEVLMAGGEKMEEMRTSVAFQGVKRTTFEYTEEEVEEIEVVEHEEEERVQQHQVTDTETDDEVEGEEEEDEGGEESGDASGVSSSGEVEEVEEEQNTSPPTSPLHAPLRAPRVAPSSPPPSEPVGDANARRLAVLQEKQKKQQQSAAEVKGFVGKIDVVGGATGKKITFDDDGEVAEIEDGTLQKAAEKEEGGGTPRVRGWLDSDDEEEDEDAVRRGGDAGYGELDDEKHLSALLNNSSGTAVLNKKKLKTLEFDDGQVDNEEDVEDQERFALRPEFLGERGKKLFEMQKRFGGDQRFRMDARFIDDEENEYADGGVIEDEGEEQGAGGGEQSSAVAPHDLQTFQEEEDAAEIVRFAQEMAQEQDQALNVIGGLFPDMDIERIRYRLASLKNKDPIKEASWMGQMMRYDPRISSSSQYELSMEDASKNNMARQKEKEVEEEEQRLVEEKKAREEKEVLIGGDRFYSASSSLGGMFSRVRKNSEDGEVGEAALDGVFGFSKPAEIKKEENKVEKEEENTFAPSAFKLSSLFSFSFGGAEESEKQLVMGEQLLEEEDEDGGEGQAVDDMPWHFAQSFSTSGRATEDEPMHLADANDDGTDKEEEDEEEEEEENTKGKPKRVRVKRSLDDFLAFGRSFFGGGISSLETAEQKAEWQKQWAERRKKLTLDFKRKRRDALKHKKKQHQQQQRSHLKKQKTLSATSQ